MAKISIEDEHGTEFVSFDEFEDLILAMEMAATLSEQVQQNPLHWKWLITSMQNAVQGAMVIALAGTDGCGALSDKSQRKNREWLQNTSSDRPAQTMADYKTLLARIQKPDLLRGPAPKLEGEDIRNLERLNELRRNFAHFNPKGWGIELNYMLAIMPVALDLVKHLTTTHDSIVIHLDGNQKQRLSKALNSSQEAIAKFKK